MIDNRIISMSFACPVQKFFQAYFGKESVTDQEILDAEAFWNGGRLLTAKELNSILVEDQWVECYDISEQPNGTTTLGLTFILSNYKTGQFECDCSDFAKFLQDLYKLARQQ